MLKRNKSVQVRHTKAHKVITERKPCHNYIGDEVPGFVVFLRSSLIISGSVGLINGLIAAAIGALRMLMSELTAKSNVKRTSMFVLSLASYTNSERNQNGITDLCKHM